MGQMISAPVADEPMGSINTTPLIDVMLVLLIMFIITIPIQSHAVKVDLPANHPAQERINPDRNRVAIAADGRLFWNGAEVDLLTLRRYFDQVAAIQPAPELQFHPHPEARYEMVDEVLAVARRANVSAMGFVGNEHYQRF